MAGAIKLKSGTKLQLAFDSEGDKQPVFNLICTFNKALDESAFLISIPAMDGKLLELDESKKLLFRYGAGEDTMFLAGYADDIVKDGIRRYWKIRRVTEQRQFFQRADERVKVLLKITYKSDTWMVNEDGTIDSEDGITLDISAGGAAVYMNSRFDVGEVIDISFPRVGTSDKGKAIPDIVAAVCWMREAPKGSLYRNLCGLQFRFNEGSDRKRMQAYIENVKDRFKL